MKTKNLITQSFLAVSLCIAAGCTKTEITSNEGDTNNVPVATPRSITLSATANEATQPRAFWTEETANKALLFNWENDESGSMKTMVWGSKGIKSFESGHLANTYIHTTETGQKGLLSITDLLAKDSYYEQNDKIHCFYPVDGTHSTLTATSGGADFAFQLPATVTQTEANSTKHLNQYIYMKGVGTVNVKEQQASSEISFSVLPVQIQFHITNAEQNDLTVSTLNLNGVLALNGNIHLDKSQQEKLTFTETQHTVEIQTSITLTPGQTVNFYTQVLPTQFTADETLNFNMLSTYSNGWTANYVDIPISCNLLTSKSGKFESNHFYAIDVEVYRDEIYMTLGNVGIQHAQQGENTEIETGPKN